MGRELPQGHRLGAYAIERLIQKTGLSTVYAARRAGAPDSERAVRVTVFAVDTDGEPWERFRREIAQLQALRHPGIAEVVEVGVSLSGAPYMVTALPEGEDLATRLRRAGAMTTREARALGRQLASALHAAHRLDVLHRDLAPENVFLVARPPADRPKAVGSQPGSGDEDAFDPVLVLGFGVARLFESALSGVAMVGNPEYMAPEQVTGFSIEVGPAADQHALGLLLYQTLTASRPFRGESVGAMLINVVRTVPEPLRALRPDVPVAVDAAVTRALAKDRLARFPDLPQFIDALQGEEAVPAGLAALTDPWLRGDGSAESAMRRAQEISGVTGSLAAVARGLDVRDASAEAALDAGGGVPQLVEDGATVPNTMEEVMRLAVPPMRTKDRISGPGALPGATSGPSAGRPAAEPTTQESVPDMVADYEPTTRAPGPPASINVKEPSIPGDLKPMRAASSGRAAKAGDSKPPAAEAAVAGESSGRTAAKRDVSSDIGDRPTSNAPIPAQVTGLVSAEEVTKRLKFERVVFALIGLMLGVLLRSLF